MRKHRTVWFLCILLTLELIVIGLLVPGDWTEKVIRQEEQLIQQQFDVKTTQKIKKRSQDWYRKTVLDTQIDSLLRDFLIPTDTLRQRSKGMEKLGTHWFEWIEGRIDALLDVFYHVLVRFSLLLVWLPFTFFLMLPALWDGLMMWQIKKQTFDYSSPVVHRYSMRILGGGAIVLLIVLFAPVVISPILMPSFCIGLSLIAGTSMAHLQKKL